MPEAPAGKPSFSREALAKEAFTGKGPYKTRARVRKPWSFIKEAYVSFRPLWVLTGPWKAPYGKKGFPYGLTALQRERRRSEALVAGRPSLEALVAGRPCMYSLRRQR